MVSCSPLHNNPGMNTTSDVEEQEAASYYPRKSMSRPTRERRPSEKLEDIIQFTKADSNGTKSMSASLSTLEIPRKKDDPLPKSRRRKSRTKKDDPSSSSSSKKNDVCFWYLKSSSRRDCLRRSLSGNDQLIMSQRLEALEVKSRGQSRPKERPTENNERALSNTLCDSIAKQDWKGALTVLQNHPEQAREMKQMKLHGTGDTCALPLHLAMSKNPPKKFVVELLSACPAGTSIKDKTSGRLPIHVFCICNTASGQILQLLVAAYPKSVKMVDQAEGRVPLHYSCLYGSPYVISILVEADVETLSCTDFHQKTPIHLAEEGSNSHKEAIVKRLVAKRNASQHSHSSTSFDMEQFARIVSENKKKWEEAHNQAASSMQDVENSMGRLSRLNQKLQTIQEKIYAEQAVLEKAKERAREDESTLDELTYEMKMIEKIERERTIRT